MMKKTTFIGIVAMTILCANCSHSGKNNQIDNSKDTTAIDSASADTSDYSIKFETLSNKDQWLRVTPSELKSDQLKRLVDAYNAAVIQNSIITDFDLQMRGYEFDAVVDAVKSIDVTKVKDQEVLKKLKAYKKEMLYLLSANPDEVNQDVHNPWKAKDELFSYLSKKYNVRTFGKIDEDKYWDVYNNCPSVPDWKQLRERRGDGDMVKELKKKYENAIDFDVRCIYAIELAHAYEADPKSWPKGDFPNPVIPILESLMKERKYSLYLNELWQKWRVLYQNSKGASKDSEIPNRLYNDYRNICACTILSYIREHPDDIMAINEFLVLACKENILREGEFSYGNQNAVDEYYLFPEKYAKSKD